MAKNLLLRLKTLDDGVPDAIGKIVDIACGKNHTIVLDENGYVYSFGKNDYGQLGNSDSSNKLIPFKVRGILEGTFLSGIIKIASKNNHGLALASDGHVYSWGYNQYGQCGDKTFITKLSPGYVLNTSGTSPITLIIKISCGEKHSAIITNLNHLYMFGNNEYGQLGIGNNTHYTYPVTTHGLNNSGYSYTVAEVSCGFNHTLILNQDGSVCAFGRNNNSQLGNGNNINYTYPIAPRDITGVLGTSLLNCIAVSAGNEFSLALTSDGHVLAWGLNNLGQLGTGDTVNKTTPVLVTLNGEPLADIVKIFAGNTCGFALASDGTLYAWGENDYGQCGDNSLKINLSPVKVKSSNGIDPLSNITLASCADHCAVIDTNKNLYAWGNNSNGQLGDGTISNYKLLPSRPLSPEYEIKIPI